MEIWRRCDICKKVTLWEKRDENLIRCTACKMMYLPATGGLTGKA